MLSIVSILSLTLFCFIKVSWASECESYANVWTYYPCSFIVSSRSLNCQYVSINSSIDQCTNREMTFFWHFPYGNMTITLHSHKNRSFLLRLSKILLTRNKLIKNVYHIVNNKTLEERLIHNNENAIFTLHSDKYNQCSLKFETANSYIVDYGTFIQMEIHTADEK
ncbi:unnamed protein product [Rotaria socialis]|uniref:Uncharacterized protein n=1 Tax=Rotaria socialis TaxID=392032 RepID=A0A819Y8Z5_9BILA|nr:unnamed protein product [Rotaria socialis]CAF4146350.1 unnamed protein product [Rotaria socialis]